ncbi:PQ-loop-domain-containing protein [Tilletiaria anomala UBC 951]|uniref:PQ-loop-domain-containing protein n=1 Tax=Tilletiaria anomala (strain ATCC 24038 / CBS 436.72 / UBC 951) TaxID=1037660 RepID=A0A066VY86_TILAU|nr:PQ-loop-domain-containing protein [Tilletiaria anomala UBC 951]KDN43774.1 PQ-loop-domain-containing protein [Tilletiaria anomala UBC 951]
MPSMPTASSSAPLAPLLALGPHLPSSSSIPSSYMAITSSIAWPVAAHALDGGGQNPPQGVLLLLALSHLLGWSYTAAWGLSFLPQILLNARRHSVTGISIDFVALNLVGFAAYAAYNLAFLASNTVRREYRERHGGVDNVVRWNDAAFAVWALLCASIQLGQVYMYKRAASQRLSHFNTLVLYAIGALVLGSSLLCASGGEERLQWLDVVTGFGYIKLWISLSKYIPQLRVNAARRSTRGFSIHNVLLDAAGGTLSLAQLALDARLSGDPAALTGDSAKLGLAIISLAMDAALCVQHYALYGPHESPLIRMHESADEEGGSEHAGEAPALAPASTADTERTPLLVASSDRR